MGHVTDTPELHNLHAERAMLGALLINADAVYRVQPLVKPGDFHDQRNAQVYAAILSLTKAGERADALTVADLMTRRNLNPDWPYISGLMLEVPTSTHAEHYARIVASFGARRRLIQAAGEIARAAYDTNTTDPMADAHAALLAVASTNGHGPQPISAAASQLYDQIEHWSANPLDVGQVRGLSTGIPGVDQLTDGLRAGDLILMAGRPSMGKSALAFEVGRRVAGHDKRVLIFSLEMPKEKIVGRWASALSQVNSRKIERGLCPDKYKGSNTANAYATPDELAAYLSAISKANDLPVEIDDQPAIGADDIRARSLATAQRVGLSLVIVDHSGLMSAERNRGENTAKTEGRKSQRMKELAKELACPVILVQQLSRAPEARSEKRPGLGDLRDSGEHEQNADIVLALYRDSYYNEHPSGSKEDLTLEVSCLKHRDGEAGTFRRLRYERHLSRFTEFAI